MVSEAASSEEVDAPAEPTPDATPPAAGGPVRVALQELATLEAPIAMANRAGDAALYIAERAGRVRALDGGKLRPEPVLDISANVSTDSERGLLGIEFSADGSVLYVSYTDAAGDSRVDAHPIEQGRADPQRSRTLIQVDQPASNHNGGNIALGPDDQLYLALGDGGGAGDPLEAAQDPSSQLGKLLRLTPDVATVASGLRNPWRFSFDRETDDLWIGDVGQNEIEEIDRIAFDDLEGANFGWDIFEGTQPYEGGDAPEGYVPPVFEYRRNEGACSVTGGYVYRGNAIPTLRGRYVYSDYCDGRLLALDARDQKLRPQELGPTVEEIVSFGEDADGELFALSLAGPVYRLVGE